MAARSCIIVLCPIYVVSHRTGLVPIWCGFIFYQKRIPPEPKSLLTQTFLMGIIVSLWFYTSIGYV